VFSSKPHPINIADIPAQSAAAPSCPAVNGKGITATTPLAGEMGHEIALQHSQEPVAQWQDARGFYVAFKAKPSRNSGFTRNIRCGQRSLRCIRCVMKWTVGVAALASHEPGRGSEIGFVRSAGRLSPYYYSIHAGFPAGPLQGGTAREERAFAYRTGNSKRSGLQSALTYIDDRGR